MQGEKGGVVGRATTPKQKRTARQTKLARQLVSQYEAHPTPPEPRFGPSTRILSQTGKDLVSTVKQAPRGFARIGKAEGLDIRDAAHAIVGGKRPAQGVGWRTHGMMRQVANETAQDFRHPLRHPGYTLLDALALAIASAGAAAAPRAASFARAAGAAAREAPSVVRAARTARAAGEAPARASVGDAARGIARGATQKQLRHMRLLAMTPVRMTKTYMNHPERAAYAAYRRGSQFDRAHGQPPPDTVDRFVRWLKKRERDKRRAQRP